jgi:hypothetical protein
MKRSVMAVVACLAMALLGSACRLGTWEDFRDPPWRHQLRLIGPTDVAYNWPTEISFKFQSGEHDVMGGSNKFTMLPGKYLYYGEDQHGWFFKGVTPCIIRSGNLGRKEEGGFFVPRGANSRIAVWLLASGSSAVYVGTGIIYSNNPGYASQATLMAWLPKEASANLRPELDAVIQKANQSADSTTSAGTSAAGQPRVPAASASHL